MNKLEIGMYVRTKKYGIAKIIGGISDKFNIDVFKKDGCTLRCQKEKDILKARFNILDLIEAGDIVVNESNNKQEVLLIDNELMVKNTGLIYDNNYYLPIKSIAIKSILTKEQFESMSYRIGE